MARERKGSNLGTLLAIGVGAASGAALVRYWQDREAALARLPEAGRVIDTPLGPVQFAEAGDGPAVLVIHGIVGGCDQGLITVEPLAARFRVIALSRPGYLQTPVIEDMSPAGQADLCAALLDALKIKDAVVIGISGGGPTAIQFAARHAGRTRALLLMCAVTRKITPDPANDTLAIRLLRAGVDSDLAMWSMLHGLLAALRARASAGAEWAARISESPARMAWYRRLLWATFPSSVRQVGSQNDRDQIAGLDDLSLKKITTPTLIFHGTRDTLVNYAHAAHAAGLIPGARLITLEGAEHSFFVSHDDMVWPEIAAFLGGAAGKLPRAAKKPSAPAGKKSAAAGKKLAPAGKKPAPAAKRPARKRKPTTGAAPG